MKTPRPWRDRWLTAAIAIVIFIAGYSYFDSIAFRDASAGAEKSRVIIEQVQQLIAQLTTAETGQRGFLLTGDPSYLADYTRSSRATQGQVLPAGTDEHERLRALITAKIAEMAEIVTIRQRGDVEAAMALVRTGKGRQAMEEIRAEAGRIVAQENARFHEHSESAQRHGYQTRTLVQLVSLLLVGLLWFSGRRISRLIGAKEDLIATLEATRESESRGRAALATTLQSIGDAVIATDAQGRVHFMNPIAEALTGWTAAEAEGRVLTDVFRIEDEETRQPASDLTAKVLREGVVVGPANHTILISKDGSEIPVDDSAAPIHGEQGETTGVVLVFRDVRLGRRAQRQLQESESRYRLLFESNPQPMWVFDSATLSFLAVNQAAINRYGYTREEFLGMTLRDIRPPEDIPALLEHTHVSERIMHTDGPWRHRKKNGDLIFVEIAAHPIQFGNTAATLVIASDISERKRLEEELRQSQKLEAVGQLAGGIAHDFNNLLTVIEGYAEMMREDLKPEHAHRSPAEEILVAAQRAASLTRQLLAFSRRQILQPIRLNLNANVTSTQRMLSRLLGENIRIDLDLSPNPWYVFADPGQVDQILLNLAVNARDAMERGGVLTLATANVQRGTAQKLDIEDGEYVCLSVSDTGEGMDEETKLHIFEPFFTTKEVGRGTGLGLSTVYGIVKQSGGHIRVTSELGKGSSFSIYLPRAGDAPPPAAKGTPAVPAGLLADETVLVVEDDATVRHLVVSMLKSAGYRVVAPATPQEALRICREFSTHLDLLLTDVVLPEIDGVEVAAKAVASRPGLRVLFMSGYTEHPVLRLPGFDRNAPFIQKPFTKAALTAKVREALQAE